MKSIRTTDLPREKLHRKGAEALSLEELVAILLQVGSRKHHVLQLARKIIRKIGGRWREATLDELSRIDGIGSAKASKILAAIEFGKRVLDAGIFQVHSSCDVIPLLQDIKDKGQEFFVIFTLNGNGNIIQRHTISQGSINSLLVHPREVFLPAVRDNACSIIAAHNHPSGLLQASTEDRRLTRNLRKAGKIMGIALLDHIIVTSTGWISV